MDKRRRLLPCIVDHEHRNAVFLSVRLFLSQNCQSLTRPRSFLITQSYAGFSVFYGWMSNNFPSPPAKRAVALALINSVSQLGNVGGSYVWQPAWAPRFRQSFLICIAASCMSIFFCYVLKRRLAAANRRLHRAEMDRGETRAGFRYLT